MPFRLTPEGGNVRKACLSQESLCPRSSSSSRNLAIGADQCRPGRRWLAHPRGERVGQALQIAASEQPDLVMASADVPGAGNSPAGFSRRAGGPGVVGPAARRRPEGGRRSGPTAVWSSRSPTRSCAGSCSATRRSPPAAAPGSVMLTSQDIFGDVLAEVESESAPFAAPPPPKPAAAPPPPASRGQRLRAGRRRDATQAGADPLGRLRPGRRAQAAPARSTPASAGPAAPPPPQAATGTRRAGSADVDALLSKTLSTLELGRPKPGVRPGRDRGPQGEDAPGRSASRRWRSWLVQGGRSPPRPPAPWPCRLRLRRHRPSKRLLRLHPS